MKYTITANRNNKVVSHGELNGTLYVTYMTISGVVALREYKLSNLGNRCWDVEPVTITMEPTEWTVQNMQAANGYIFRHKRVKDVPQILIGHGVTLGGKSAIDLKNYWEWSHSVRGPWAPCDSNNVPTPLV